MFSSLQSGTMLVRKHIRVMSFVICPRVICPRVLCPPLSPPEQMNKTFIPLPLSKEGDGGWGVGGDIICPLSSVICKADLRTRDK